MRSLVALLMAVARRAYRAANVPALVQYRKMATLLEPPEVKHVLLLPAGVIDADRMTLGCKLRSAGRPMRRTTRIATAYGKDPDARPNG